MMRKYLLLFVFLELTVPFAIPSPGLHFLEPLRGVHLWIHATLFLILGVFWATQLPRKLLLGLLLPLLAASLEAVQIFVPTRHFCYVDMSFNVGFSALGYIGAVIVSHWMESRGKSNPFVIERFIGFLWFILCMAVGASSMTYYGINHPTHLFELLFPLLIAAWIVVLLGGQHVLGMGLGYLYKRHLI
jgi:VanZ family protein